MFEFCVKENGKWVTKKVFVDLLPALEYMVILDDLGYETALTPTELVKSTIVGMSKEDCEKVVNLLFKPKPSNT